MSKIVETKEMQLWRGLGSIFPVNYDTNQTIFFFFVYSSRYNFTISNHDYSFFSSIFSVNVYPYILVKLVCRSAMRVGNCTAWSMAFSPTDRCRQTKLLAVVMIASTHFSARPEPENMSREPYSLTWSQQLSVN